MRLNKWQSIEEMVQNDKCRVEETPDDFEQPEKFMLGIIKVEHPTHLLYNSETNNLLMVLSVEGLGTDNGYIVGVNCYGDSNHDLSPHEVASIFRRAYERDSKV